MSIKNEILKTRRKALGLTLEDIAQKLHTTKQTIQKYENGIITHIPLDKIEQLAAILQITPALIMGWEENHLPLPEETSPHNPVMRRIPILGAISAGLPLYAEEQIEGYTYTDLNHSAEYFALMVKGDSMNAAQIINGNIIIVRRQDTVEDGDIAVVIVGDENATVKRFYQSNGIITLMPQSTNPQYKPQIYDLKKIPVRVIGRVMETKIVY